MQRIVPCLWFDDQAEAAAKFYTSLFKHSKIKQISKYGKAGANASQRPVGSVMTVTFDLNGQSFMGLNGGPVFKPTPAISLMVHCKTVKDVDDLYNKLSKGGQVMMELDKYPFSERYAFLQDKFGVSWQVMLSDKEPHITPSMLFVGEHFGEAETALKFYTTVFKNSKVQTISYYEKGEPGEAGTVKFASFLLDGQEFSVMDGPGEHHFTFNEGFSLMIYCKDQKEIDYFWEKLTKGGEESVCGWLKDKFGVSWQVVPAIIDEHMKDQKKADKFMEAVLQMKKLDVKKLQAAYDKA